MSIAKIIEKTPSTNLSNVLYCFLRVQLIKGSVFAGLVNLHREYENV